MSRQSSRRKQATQTLRRLWIRFMQAIVSRPVRGIIWVIVSIITSGGIAFAAWAIRLVFTGNTDYQVIMTSWVLLAILFALTNLLIVFRSEYMEYDPWIDLRYHARIHEKISGNASQFLLTFHRTGSPEEMYYSRTSTVNRIEQAFPFTLTMTSTAAAFLGFFVVSFFSLMKVSSMPLQGLTALTGIFIGISFLLYFGIGQGILSPWRKYRRWKDFWTAYWEYILSKTEPSERIARIIEERGAWHSIVGWRLWGTDFNLKRKDILSDIKMRASALLLENSINDSLPTSTENLVDYLDSLTLYLDIKESISHNTEVLEILAEKSKIYETALNNFNHICSLKESNIRKQMNRMDDLLSLIPVAALSLHAFREVSEVDPLPTKDLREMRDWAESRLEHFWGMPGSPIPSSLKWITAFYSLSSLVVTWLPQLFL